MSTLARIIFGLWGLGAGLEAGSAVFPHSGVAGALAITFAVWFAIIGVADYAARKFGIRL
jgi:hypothetical protein